MYQINVIQKSSHKYSAIGCFSIKSTSSFFVNHTKPQQSHLTISFMLKCPSKKNKVGYHRTETLKKKKIHLKKNILKEVDLLHVLCIPYKKWFLQHMESI